MAALLAICGSGMARTVEAPSRRGDVAGRSTQSAPAHALVAHRVGKIVLGLSNNGTFGNKYTQGVVTDWFTGEEVPSCEYPKGSNNKYLYGGAFWIGAVVRGDTLVSVGADSWQLVYEFNPPPEPFGNPVYRSIIDPTAQDAEDAVSEEDFIMVYTDTVTQGIPNDFMAGRPHIPLNIEVTEASYAWSYGYAEDLILFDYQIKNIGRDMLEDVYMGILVDCDVSWEGLGDAGANDDIAGFVHTMMTTHGNCTYEDTVFIAYSADNDGELDVTLPDGQPVPHATGTRIVRTPSTDLDVSFNWWLCNGNSSLDFGPREKPLKGRLKENFRDFGTGGLGTPEGDANKYYVMSNQEFDYDQCFTASINAVDTLWMFPPQEHVDDWADGRDTRYLLSFGPFQISPGEMLPVSFAYLGGKDLHRDVANGANLPANPNVFYGNLDFSDLALNSRWASWIYDNPGVDTDGSGYAGEYFLCPKDPAMPELGYDTVWTRGDGVPDFKGASPPPAPEFWVEPSVGSLVLRINGLESESTPDRFSRRIDFEGYRVYIGRDDREESYSMVGSYDRENYNKYVRITASDWQLYDEPFSLQELRCLYGDSCGDVTFDPLTYTRESPYSRVGLDSTFAFVGQDHNASIFGITSPIRKRFPNQPYPTSLNPSAALPDEVTDDGYLKYFEYEYEIEGLLPSVEYWVNVTAFDFGSPSSGLLSLETSVTVGAQSAYAMSSCAEVAKNNLKAYVYPNPYRIDGNYRATGLEGRADSDRAEDRVRAVNFANLPARCTISIFSLDGDLVRQIEHDYAVSDPNGMHDSWDLITRNTQLAVSGLYYWVVEAEDGRTQLGKLVLIL